MPVTTARRTSSRGVLAGAVAVAAGIPALFVAVVLAIFVQRATLSQLLGRLATMTELSSGEQILANALFAALVGTVAAVVGSTIALRLIRDAATAPFVATVAIGAQPIALWLYRHLLPSAGGHAIALASLLAVGWAAALLGALSTAQVRGQDIVGNTT